MFHMTVTQHLATGPEMAIGGKRKTVASAKREAMNAAGDKGFPLEHRTRVELFEDDESCLFAWGETLGEALSTAHSMHKKAASTRGR